MHVGRAGREVCVVRAGGLREWEEEEAVKAWRAGGGEMSNGQKRGVSSTVDKLARDRCRPGAHALDETKSV